jgi:glycogen debranching enzyme
MIGTVRVPQPIMVLHGGGVALASGLDGQVHAEQRHGLFAGDTRVLSTYRLSVNSHAWRLLGRSRGGHGTAQWEFLNPCIRDPTGDIPEGRLLLSVRRRVDGVVHDDLRLCAFVMREVKIRLSLQIDADFADIFQVRHRSTPPRLNIRREPGLCGGSMSYDRKGFSRRLHVHCEALGCEPIYVGSLVIFELTLAPGMEWVCCVDLIPELDGDRLQASGDPHDPEPDVIPRFNPEGGRLSVVAGPLLDGPFDRGCRDLRALALRHGSGSLYLAGGVPWFLTLFGRDSLMAALTSGVEGAWSAVGALAALGELQATERNDWRDAEPGKIPHEIRRGELAWENRMPHAAYYGTHDAPALYCLTLWHAWRWTGDRRLLDRHLETARAALRWCEELGDRDGDGLQEYSTRSDHGYYNQGWKDSGDAIVHADGRLAELPIGTVELQGYLFAAYLAMAELLQECGNDAEAGRLRQAAWTLRDLVEQRFWLAEESFYALALDGKKRRVASISSNPGHLLWCGLPASDRAATVARRFMEPDLFSGWGLRTLSSHHPAYNPLSYQLGSIWPHDTALAAAGLWRYGQFEAADRLIEAILEAASAFEAERLPELFCGLDRSHGLPVPYEEANSPQAWAAAVPLLFVQLFLGLVPDAPRRRFMISPRLPTWLPRLDVRGLAVGHGQIDVSLSRQGVATVIDNLNAKDLEVVEGQVMAPLWGLPPSHHV